MSTQSEYYMRRAAAERRWGALTPDPKVASAHIEMAERYDALASDARIPTEVPGRSPVQAEHRLER